MSRGVRFEDASPEVQKAIWNAAHNGLGRSSARRQLVELRSNETYLEYALATLQEQYVEDVIGVEELEEGLERILGPLITMERTREGSV